MNAPMEYDSKYREEVLDYFRGKAEEYDLVDEQAYWRLSDTLLWQTLESHILSNLPSGFRFLDAGGGTGRWSDRILRARPDASGVLFDMSADMTAKAAEKAERGDYRGRFEIRNGELEDVAEALRSSKFDLIFNFHNVLGFVQDVESVVRQLASLLVPGGWLVSFVPNRYHTVFFNVFSGRLDEAEVSIRSEYGRFTTTMPLIRLFTPSGLRGLYTQAGLSMELLTGFPSFLYPGVQETQLRGSTSSLDELLGSPERFDRLVRLEQEMLLNPEIASRGNNLFAAGRKQG